MTYFRQLFSSGGTAVVIAANVRNPDIRALAIAAGWNGFSPVSVTINSGVDVAALIIPATIPNDLLTLINNGRIGGMSGGGAGLTVRTRIIVTNNGTIFGAGGDGGDGESVTIFNATAYSATGNGGSGGVGARFSSSGAVVLYPATSGGSGGSSKLDGPTTGGGSEPGYAYGGDGGSGGEIGQSGSGGGGASASGTYHSPYYFGRESGFPAGYYVDGNSYVTWQVVGMRLGRVI